MKRKIVLIFQLTFALLIFLSTSGCRFPFVKDERPNFLIIVTDDQRFDTMEYMPNTQQLIFDQGVTFSSGYITTPFCCPSRASILTGLYAHNHYVYVNTDDLLLPTLVDDLHKNGYYTGLVGKYLNSWDGSLRPEFDYWVTFWGGTVPHYYDPELNVNGDWGPRTGYITYLFEDYVKEYLDLATNQRKPFFLLFAPNAPHAPFTPLKEDKGLLQDLALHRPPSFSEEDISDKPSSIANKPPIGENGVTSIDNTRRRQLLTLIALDRSIGAIMQKLEETGELDNTVVIFLSDNGKHWGEHRMDTKSTAYEEVVKVPFAMRYPTLIPAPYIEGRLVANIDIAPTIYELSETRMPKVIDGLSLVDLLNGDGEWRSNLLLEAWPDRGHWKAVHTGQYVYIDTIDDISEFYDLVNDPFQLENAINDPQFQDTIAELQAFIQTESEPRLPPPEK
ncbi:MAG TPA: sulfatase-like hydrolase/transferase [Anaerolineales bacterium]|nr:sulfatase-like hydrolase/transferase [Anaerolineales bacterium]